MAEMMEVGMQYSSREEVLESPIKNLLTEDVGKREDQMLQVGAVVSGGAQPSLTDIFFKL